MVRAGRSLFLIQVFLCLPASVYAQRSNVGAMDNERRTLGGTVYFPGNKPAENVSVGLLSSEGSFMAPANTNASGGFEFYNLTPGTYALQVDQSGYERIEVSVDLTLTSNRGIVIYLAPIASNSSAAGHGASSATVSAHELSMPQKARELMASGKKKLYQDKDAQASLEDFQQAVAVAPGYYEAEYQIGIAALTLGKPDDAEKDFRKSIELSGDKFGEASIGLGKILLDKGDAPAAEKVLLHGVEFAPTSSRGYYELGRAQLVEKRLSAAEESATQSRTLAPEFPMVYRLLSNIHLQQKNYTALLEDLNAYIKLDPDSPAGARAKQLREQLQPKQTAAEQSGPPAHP